MIDANYDNALFLHYVVMGEDWSPTDFSSRHGCVMVGRRWTFRLRLHLLLLVVLLLLERGWNKENHPRTHVVLYSDIPKLASPWFRRHETLGFSPQTNFQKKERNKQQTTNHKRHTSSSGRYRHLHSHRRRLSSIPSRKDVRRARGCPYTNVCLLCVFFFFSFWLIRWRFWLSFSLER